MTQWSCVAGPRLGSWRDGHWRAQRDLPAGLGSPRTGLFVGAVPHVARLPGGPGLRRAAPRQEYRGHLHRGRRCHGHVHRCGGGGGAGQGQGVGGRRVVVGLLELGHSLHARGRLRCRPQIRPAHQLPRVEPHHRHHRHHHRHLQKQQQRNNGRFVICLLGSL
ncbi:uncharacterized protein ACA1_141310 [Acanthamoeba castellanii str. Neff]|uniref:Uncharacterized protein n=1 Tax=Acanthamoeba castellanii (strain ATCC 30010 / Neff) TaxID=1257118 RepID=L8HB50_ACACF|nr:uncharacterized protein ACA1_141310 [Acanthamoeba castellanii str. Neff]ELR22482.1 hypothetical protein ACA1_141310 [Acanthamoeba castellanii str. Neff]